MKSKLAKLLCLAPLLFASLSAFEDDAKKNMNVETNDVPKEDAPETTSE